MKADTELINSMIDIRAVAEGAGAEFRGNRSRCPIHKGENSSAFEIWDGGKAWTCHTRQECNEMGHDGIGLLRALHGWSFNEVKERYTTNPQPIDPQEAARRAVENAERAERELQEKIAQAQKAIEELRKAKRWMQDHENMSAQARAEWERRGIPESWQSWFLFGYRENFSYNHAGDWYTSPSLTIPIFNTTEVDPVQVRHRILNPVDPQDKYRPEKSGIEALPFLGDRTLPLECATRVIIVEGEIKAAVTFLTLDRPAWQVVGIPGKQIWGKLSAHLEGRHDTIIMLDPDAKAEAVKMARSIGGARVVDLADKIDDLIINYDLDAGWLDSVFHNARFIK